jgi:hypothetical protein
MTSAARDLSEEQRCFVDDAAHELRGEITLQLALAEAALADPNADMAALKEMGEGVVAAFERQERLLEPLLTLARCEYGHLRREPVDLAATAAGVLRAHDHGELRSTLALEPARTTGDYTTTAGLDRKGRGGLAIRQQRREADRQLRAARPQGAELGARVCAGVSSRRISRTAEPMLSRFNHAGYSRLSQSARLGTTNEMAYIGQILPP